jgi:hypothetical protein
MKYLRSFLYLAIFLTNLLVGYLGGLRVFPANPKEAVSLAHSESIVADTPIPSLANGQRSLLLITADQLEAREPRLIGVWLVVYVPSDPRLTLLPIFPAPSMKDAGKELSDAFRLQNNAGHMSPDPQFLEIVRELIPWWSGYILLDEPAIAEMIDYMVYFEKASQSPNPNHFSQILSELSMWQDPYSSLFGQASLYQEMCWGIAWMEAGTTLAQLQDRFAFKQGHFSTDLTADHILAEIQNLRGQAGSIVCEFPTLSVQARIVK